jgi:hypothetical protein
LLDVPAPFGMPALSDTALFEIRNNLLSRRFDHGTFQQLEKALVRDWPVVPDELYTVQELKMNMLNA